MMKKYNEKNHFGAALQYFQREYNNTEYNILTTYIF